MSLGEFKGLASSPCCRKQKMSSSLGRYITVSSVVEDESTDRKQFNHSEAAFKTLDQDISRTLC